MKQCKYCNSEMISEYESKGNAGKSYNAFHNCLNCHAVCEEKVIEYRGGRIDKQERWFNPTTKEFEVQP